MNGFAAGRATISRCPRTWPRRRISPSRSRRSCTAPTPTATSTRPRGPCVPAGGSSSATTSSPRPNRRRRRARPGGWPSSAGVGMWARCSRWSGSVPSPPTMGCNWYVTRTSRRTSSWRRPRDRFIAALVALGRPFRLTSDYWQSLVGGNALQLALKHGLVHHRFLEFHRPEPVHGSWACRGDRRSTSRLNWPIWFSWLQR